MTTEEIIKEKAARLPGRGQSDLLAFIEYLLLRYSAPSTGVKEANWNAFSTSSAIGDDEESSAYDDIDYKEKWR